mmetsp:Transcript_23110/g.47523  ORF Transcript_23110/g.47523 Transcript_23110/m.47523 type:complete len:907 (-) Transcript_23110:129-2849(-)
MTTISTRSTHSNPLARTKGGCANHQNSLSSGEIRPTRSSIRRFRGRRRQGEFREDDDDHGSDSGIVLPEDDEEIESVEADGTGHGDDGGTMSNLDGSGCSGAKGSDAGAEVKQVSTAGMAVISSFAPGNIKDDGTSGCHNENLLPSKKRQKSDDHVTTDENDAQQSGVYDYDAATERNEAETDWDLEDAIHSGIESFENSMQQKDDTSGVAMSPSEGTIHGTQSAPLVTPPSSEPPNPSTLESTKNNSVCHAPHASNPPSNLLSNSVTTTFCNPESKFSAPATTALTEKQTTTRTIYPRASKAAACTKVAGLISSPVRKTASTESAKKRNNVVINMKSAISKSEGDSALANVNSCHASASVPPTSNSRKNKPAIQSVLETTQPTKPKAKPKASRGVMAPIPPSVNSNAYAKGPSPVPNPLAGYDESLCNPDPSSTHSTETTLPDEKHRDDAEKDSNSENMSSKTCSLMSAAPNAALPPTTHSSRRHSEDQLGNNFSTIAESMSSQQWQTDGLASTAPSDVPEVRGRIFSIDLDPSILDFADSVGDPLGDEDPAPDAPTSNAEAADNKNVTFKLEETESEPFSRSGSNGFLRRDRGFSFEFFSFGFSDDDVLPLTPTLTCDQNDGKNISSASIGSRMRGDSIIFDPISFRDGGVHETSALMHVKKEQEPDFVENVSADNKGADSKPAPNPPVTQTATVVTSAPPPAQAQAQTMILPQVPQSDPNSQKKPASFANITVVNNAALSASCHPRPTYVKQRMRAKIVNPVVNNIASNAPGRYTQGTAAASFMPHGFASNNTIHMPHGSDAAAAAAAGMPPSHLNGSQNSANSEGFAISHTACPMELLNKGGRIGIYLPEERKARIAKFHSKRKIRIWRKRIKYDCRKKLADSRPRIKGRFVKRSDVDGEDE